MRPLRSGLLALSLVFLPSMARADEGPVRFDRDILPILSDRCFVCHGPDAAVREAELRLDVREALFEDRGGYAVVVPGRPEDSELYQRIAEPDPDLRMPPSDSGKELSPAERDLLRRWIEQGAEWGQHWAYRPLSSTLPPEVDDPRWNRNPIDRFLHASLAKEGRRPAEPAASATFLRRLALDLTGLPPDEALLREAAADDSPEAEAARIERLLESPQHAERMALFWLDLVRYADTDGFHSDRERTIWPYRDWVIDAFRRNLPFDQFTLEQLAGDLLPERTTAQWVASGYNRLNMTTKEAGAQEAEYRAKYAADRVRTTSTVWLGSTLGCAECHDHKFDPFTTREFYEFSAFFADLQEQAVGRPRPTPLPDAEQRARLDELDGYLAQLEELLGRDTPELAGEREAWESATTELLREPRPHWRVLRPAEMLSEVGSRFELRDDDSVFVTDGNAGNDTYLMTLPLAEPVHALRLELLCDEELSSGRLSRGKGDIALSGLAISVVPGLDQAPVPVPIAEAFADHSAADHPLEHVLDEDAGTAWSVDGRTRREDRAAVFRFATPVAGAQLLVQLAHESPERAFETIGRFRLSVSAQPTTGLGAPSVPQAVAEILLRGGARDTSEQARIAAQHRSIAPSLDDERAHQATLRDLRRRLLRKLPTSLVSISGPPREVRILPRGNWRDDRGEVVQAAVPGWLAPMPAADGRPGRLELARWLMSDDNPLTARVLVNRLWRLFFGAALSGNVDDLGAQGEYPRHPELLDWLAREFRDSGWDLRHMIRTIVRSEAYRQSSRAREDGALEAFARQSAHRLPAEMVRDAALSVSGLLNPAIGGPSVKPYQPEGYWDQLGIPRREWRHELGADLYRRSLYTFWCRSFLNPRLLAFDAPTREECVGARSRSNTPLQALCLLNDPTFVEAARHLAARLLDEGAARFEDRLDHAFTLALGRAAEPAERALFDELWRRHREAYAADPEAAGRLLAVGASAPRTDLDVAELAAWTSVARALFNTHEFITRN